MGDTHHKIVIRDGDLLQKNGYRFFRCRRDITILTSRDETDNHSRVSELYGLLKLHRHLNAAIHSAAFA
jgi:hypothetical protein